MADPVENPLFTPTELNEFSDADVSLGRAAMVERVVWGWVKPKLRPVLTPPDVRPTPLDETVYSIALQLGAIIAENPTLLQSSGDGADSTTFGGRSDIRGLLDDLEQWVADHGGNATNGVPAPRGRFPKSRPYPDPAGCRVSRWP